MQARSARFIPSSLCDHGKLETIKDSADVFSKSNKKTSNFFVVITLP